MDINMMDERQARALFAVAGIKVLAIKALIDGYGYNPSDPRFFSTPPREAWWFVKTEAGWIEIGWRKRVIQIDWTHTAARGEVTEDATTKSDHDVHAWSEEDAVKYLKALRPMLERSVTPTFVV